MKLQTKAVKSAKVAAVMKPVAKPTAPKGKLRKAAEFTIGGVRAFFDPKTGARIATVSDKMTMKEVAVKHGLERIPRKLVNKEVVAALMKQWMAARKKK